jgi:hypothetical protein
MNFTEIEAEIIYKLPPSIKEGNVMTTQVTTIHGVHRMQPMYVSGCHAPPPPLLKPLLYCV